MRSALHDRTWDVLIVADEAAEALGREIVVELSLRGLKVELDTERGPVLSEAMLNRAKVARHALVLSSVGSRIRFALLTAAPHRVASPGERGMQIGKLGGDVWALLDLILQRMLASAEPAEPRRGARSTVSEK